MGNMSISRRNFIRASGAGVGLGFFYIPGIGRVEASPRSMQYTTDYYGRMCYNENPLGPSPNAIKAIQDNANMAHRYPDWYNVALERVIADFHDVSYQNVCVCAGAIAIMKLTAFAFLSEGDEIVVPYPSYKLMTGQAVKNGATIVQVPVNADYTVNLSAMSDAITDKTKMVYLINPSNPLPRIIPKTDLEAFIRAVPAGVVVVINECYYQYVHSPDYGSVIPLIKEDLPLIVINTFSKALGMAGARVGYSIASTDLTGAIAASQTYGTVTRTSHAAAEAALLDEDHLKKTIDLNDEAKDYLATEFDAMGLSYVPSEGNHMLFDTGTNNAASVVSQLDDKGYRVRGGNEWDMPRHIRVSTGLMEENRGFITALKEILSTKISSSTARKQFALSAVYPNPFRTSCKVKFSVKDNEKTIITIFSCTGRTIRTLINAPLRSGTHYATWDGKDTFGKPVAAGLYIIQLNQASSTALQRVRLIK